MTFLGLFLSLSVGRHLKTASTKGCCVRREGGAAYRGAPRRLCMLTSPEVALICRGQTEGLMSNRAAGGSERTRLSPATH